MYENPFISKIEELKQGAIEELVVEVADFFLFREAWLQLPDRMDIKGEAGLNGKIIYRYVKKDDKQS
ncbi:hypothetical protein ACSFB8_03385 [Enterococcus faecalis]